MDILVTGGAGLVGAAVCAGLVERGHRVRCLDRVPSRIPGVESRVADLLQRGETEGYFEGTDAVIHLANHANQWRADARTILAENSALNANVFQSALEAGVRRMVFSSSVQTVSGVPLCLGRGEAGRAANRAAPRPKYPLSGDSLAKPGNPYAASKVAGEQLLRYYAEVHEVAATALRLPFVAKSRSGLERQALAMAHDTWPHEGFSWLWAGDLGGLFERVLVTSLPGYRCLFPSGPVMDAIPELAEILARDPEARVEALEASICGEWRATPYERLPEGKMPWEPV